MTSSELQRRVDGLRDLLWAERQHHALTRSELDQARDALDALKYGLPSEAPELAEAHGTP